MTRPIRRRRSAARSCCPATRCSTTGARGSRRRAHLHDRAPDRDRRGDRGGAGRAVGPNRRGPLRHLRPGLRRRRRRRVAQCLRRAGPDHPGGRNPTADGVWRVTVALWPMGHRFAAGHRIRLQVSSGAHPRYARNSGHRRGSRPPPRRLRPVPRSRSSAAAPGALGGGSSSGRLAAVWSARRRAGVDRGHVRYEAGGVPSPPWGGRGPLAPPTGGASRCHPAVGQPLPPWGAVAARCPAGAGRRRRDRGRCRAGRRAGSTSCRSWRSARVIATPVRPARPVRPTRWT